MTRVEIQWPDSGAERVRAAQGKLLLAGRDLRTMRFEDRLGRVGRVLSSWTDTDSPWRRELAQSLAETSPFDRATLTEGLDQALLAWDPEDFIRCAQREMQTVGQSPDDTLVPFEWTTVWAGGSIPMPTIHAALLPLVLGSPVLLRETRKDTITAGLVARSLREEDERLARAFCPIHFPTDDLGATDVALSAPCVVATGSDETLRALSQQMKPSQRFVGYGHRFSVAVLGPHPPTSPDEESRWARGLALDIVRWDQSGCLSPVVAYLVGFDLVDRIRITELISDHLAKLSRTMPRGEVDDRVRAQISNERSDAQMRQSSHRAVRLIKGDGFSVVLESTATPRPAPLHRFLRLHPVADLDALEVALAPFAGQISSAAVAGFSPEMEGVLVGRLLQNGVSRISPPGKQQTPPVDWPHDGLPVFLPLARFATTE